MGVTDLVRVIMDRAPEAVRTVRPHELAGTVCIDISIVIHQMANIGRTRNIVNVDGKHIGHLLGVFHRMISLMDAGITPVAIFDGPPPALKRAAIDVRKERHYTDPALALPRGAIGEVRLMLRYMGIVCVAAPGEAEAWAARGGTFATEDTDAIVFGLFATRTPARIVLGLDSNGPARVIDVRAALTGLGMTADQFIDMCAMLGTDYNDGLKGVGRARAPDLIAKYGSALGVLKYLYGDAIPRDIAAALNHDAVWETYSREATAAIAAPMPIAPDRDLAALADFLRAHRVDEKKIAAGIGRLAGL